MQSSPLGLWRGRSIMRIALLLKGTSSLLIMDYYIDIDRLQTIHLSS